MRLFNAGSMFSEEAIRGIMPYLADKEALREKLVAIKKMLMEAYRFQVLEVPEDFTSSSYVIATNHLTDADAPLIISAYYTMMCEVLDRYPQIFVFAKENCFNGVSIPTALAPVLEMESIVPVDRNSVNGSMAAMKAAGQWFAQETGPKHFLIFAQGTIYDINRDKAEDIEPGAFWLARRLGIQVLPAFIEQAVEGEENRLVFGEPLDVPKHCRDFTECKQLWLERVIKAQDSLTALTGVPARPVTLDEEHQIRKRFRQLTIDN